MDHGVKIILGSTLRVVLTYKARLRDLVEIHQGQNLMQFKCSFNFLTSPNRACGGRDIWEEATSHGQVEELETIVILIL